MALSFIGKPISLISHSDVRYKGILAGIDPQASTIQLSNVYSMGTESRRPPAQFIAPVQEPYGYIIFRASEVKDLAVDEPPPPQRSVHDDPAVLGASSAPPTYSTAVGASPIPAPQQPYPTQQQQPPTAAATTPQTQAAQAQAQAAPAAAAPRAPNRRANPVHTAAASLETVERALGDLRVSGGGAPAHTGRGGRRGHGGPRGGRGGETEQIKVPTTDFDFESSNAKFDKAAHSPAPQAKEDGTEGSESANASEGGEGEKPAEKEQAAPAYNPQKSFFDSLSSSSAAPAAGSGGGHHGGGGRGRRGGGGGGGNGGGGGGGAIGRNRREEERERNVATFGEPGGVGLLGPGGYVGGWGGYGRRGGRPRRGGAGGGGGRGGGNGQATVQAARV
ncbi:Scd6-like Sm domain-containing protein [Crassisporium funariophilum]|nr:Scd6-like Sm domain-containing protein [Crassisporium funariophilum]